MQRYRGDIEGLRAIAVIPIVLFHAGIDILRGGYVGVDIFFVISGFLITQTILNENENGSFSILGFYQRRVARIFPALFLMLAVAGLCAGFILRLPDQTALFFKSLAFSAMFGSNVFFWTEVGYFTPTAETQALLHTWSLGVEEQFYIIFPLLIYAIRNTSRRAKIGILGCVAALSLIAGSIVNRSDPLDTFYLLQFRAWELLIGVLLALGAAPRLSWALSTIAALAGAGLIAVSVLFMASWLPFPSPLALLPCVGAALIIAYGENTVVGRALSLRPFRSIGIISFSLYLWHWPIIAFYREAMGISLDGIESAILTTLSFGAAAASYILVEKPARIWLRAMSERKAVTLGIAGSIAFFGVAFAVALNAPRIWSVDPEVERIASYQDYRGWFDYPEKELVSGCFIQHPDQDINRDACLSISETKPDVLLFGDSHAAMYSVALRRQFVDVNWLEASHYGCPPLRNGWRNAGCVEMVELVLSDVLKNGRVDGVVLVGRWREDQAAQLQATIAELSQLGIAVNVIGPAPEYDGSLPVILAKAADAGSLEGVQRFLDPAIARKDEIIASAATGAGARYHSSYATLCPDQACDVFAPDGGPIAYDDSHLTIAGAQKAIAGFKLLRKAATHPE